RARVYGVSSRHSREGGPAGRLAAMTRRRVVVLFGGRSSEHEISCLSARSVIDALEGDDGEVVPLGIAREGRCFLLPGPPALPSESGRMPGVVADMAALARLAGDDG